MACMPSSSSSEAWKAKEAHKGMLLDKKYNRGDNGTRGRLKGGRDRGRNGK